MIVVSDTSPLSNLALVDGLFLLREIYNTVVIPQAVAKELSNAKDED
jgi:predicted nucleic acid-binding protein